MLTKARGEVYWPFVGCLWALTQVWSVERGVHQQALTVCITNSTRHQGSWKVFSRLLRLAWLS